MVSEIDYAYLAGLIDGEGSISLSAKTNNRYPCLSMVSTTIELIDFVKNTFGGPMEECHASMNGGFGNPNHR